MLAAWKLTEICPVFKKDDPHHYELQYDSPAIDKEYLKTDPLSKLGQQVVFRKHKIEMLKKVNAKVRGVAALRS